MNIIELLERFSSNRVGVIQLTSIEINTIIHQIEVEKITNSSIDKDLSNQLIFVLHNYSQEVQFLINNRKLHQIYTKTDLSNVTFPKENVAIDVDKVKSLLTQFLETEMRLFFTQNLEQNNFDVINDLMSEREYFPENIWSEIVSKSYEKIDLAIQQVTIPNSDLSKILYVKTPIFYEFLSYIKSDSTDHRLRLLLDSLEKMYAINNKSEFAGTSIISMYSYDAVNKDFIAQIKKKRSEVYEIKSSSGTWKYSDFPWKIIVGLVIIIRIVFLVIKWSANISNYESSDPDNNYDEQVIEQEQVLDPYYTKMKKRIDSFHVFLVDYNKDEMQYIKSNDTIKTGENPFENLYLNPPTPDNGNPIVFKNRTKYDIILLENPLAYDSIKMPGRAYFIKSGANYQLNDVTLQLKRVFNFYVGNGLASFKTNSNHIFVRNHSIMEPRFIKLLPDSKNILEKDYTFSGNKVIIKEKGATIEVLE